jgi:hypothetical protein
MLAGVMVIEADTSEEAEAAVSEHLDGGCRLLIVQDDLRRGFSETFQERLLRHRGEPLVVYCPLFDEDVSGVDAYVSAVLKPAIGYEIRLD